MEEIKVGDYIRTIEPYGEIYKVIGREQEDILLIDSLGNNRVETGYVSKHSPNIIDLIEVGDYVNGYEVLIIRNGIPYIEYSNEFDDYTGYITNDTIKSIVTHEQFNSIKYEVI